MNERCRFPSQGRGLACAWRWHARRPGPLALALATLIFAGCADHSPGSDTGANGQLPETIALDLTTPEHAARSVLLCLRAERRAIARGDDAAARRYRGLLPALVARKELITPLEARLRRLNLSEQQLVDEFTALWGAVVAYYIEDVELDQMRRAAGGEAGSRAIVLVPARGADDTALIRVGCVRVAEGDWRILDIGFQAERAASRPATGSAG